MIMTYNQNKTAAGQVMPLLMGCTMPTPIENENAEHKILYDPLAQKVVMDMRIVGTKSLRTVSTGYTTTTGHRSTKSDRKNEIDDTKNV